MSIEFIESADQFTTSFKQFKKESKINDKSSIYLVGFDCEYISKSNYPESFEKSCRWIKKSSYDTATCIIQLANEKSCLIIDLTKIGPDLPSSLIEIIKSENWIKTGVGVGNDITYLSDNFDLGQCNGGIDIKHFAELAGCTTPNLEHLNNTLGFHPIDKSIIKTKCDWSEPLTVAHLKYAANDAIASYNLGKKFIIDAVGSLKQYFVSDEGKASRSSIKLSSGKSQNYVGMLQEHAQKNKFDVPIYVVEVLETNKFKCVCSYLDKTIECEGQSKQSAKNVSAKCMVGLVGL